jgi:pseudouridine synthase
VEKVYHAEVQGRPSRAVLETLRRGVEIGGGVRTSPAKARLIASKSDSSTIEISIHEGRKRQVKRMCKAVGHSVIRLKRVEFGGIRLGNLKSGEYRLLSDSEVAKLRKKTRLDPE